MNYLIVLAITAMLGGGAYVTADRYLDTSAETDAEVTTDMRVEGSSANEMEVYEDTNASLMTRLSAFLGLEGEATSETNAEATTKTGADADASVDANTSVDVNADADVETEAENSSFLKLKLGN